MRRPIFGVAACGLVLAFVVAGAAGARTQAASVKLTAAMSSGQEVPRPTGNLGAARGTFTAAARASGTGAVVTWRLTFRGLSGSATAAHIHVAPRGKAGPVVVPLCGPCRSGASGRETVDASVRAALAAGRAYVNVHTAANAAGEIRGQIAVLARIRTALNARQERPRPEGAVGRARAAFAATVMTSGSSAVVSWRLTFSRLTGRAVAAHIHLGARGKPGRVVVPLCGPCRSGVRGRANVRGAVLRALEQGRTYVNVHTARNPAGEVRGQIAAVPLSLTGGSGSGGGSPPPPPPPPPTPPYPPPGDPYP
ncbi:MAG: CHRD domain-containing protein [Gaiellaceae bacterium]